MVKQKQDIHQVKTALLKAVKKCIQQQEKELFNKQSNKVQSSNHKVKKSPQVPIGTFKQEQLYDELVNILDKLKKIRKRMNSIHKLKKQKLNIFNPKLVDFINQLENLIETRGVNIKIDKQIEFLIQQTNKSLTQCDRILTALERQSGYLCCGGKTTETKYSFYKAIISILGYGTVWSILPLFSPIIQQKIQKVEVYTPLKINFNILENLIENQIQKHWPQPQIIQQNVPCQRPHIDSQLKLEEKHSSVSSLSESSSQVTQQLTHNYMKIQQVLKLKQNLELQTMLRQAHQKLHGFGRPQDVRSAIDTYKRITNKKNQKIRFAYNALGQIYEEGKFQQIDRQKSEQYYRQSANLGDPQGLYKIGKYLEKGLIKIHGNQMKMIQKRHQQLRTAIQYYERAAQLDHLDAITDLGYIYQKGLQNNIPPLHLSQVSKSQSQISQSQVSTVKAQKYFIQPNLKHAVKYYTKAKKVQFPRALNNLGSLLVRQNQFIDQKVKGTNLQKGLKYLKKAAHLNYIKSFYNIGKCYQNGIGVAKNQQNARRYYLKGSEKGDTSCKIQYIKSCLGDSTHFAYPNQESLTIKVLEMIRQVLIIDPKNKECLFYMGLFYEKGQGVLKNPEAAYSYIKQSAKYNYLPAITKLGDYNYSGFYVSKNIQQAVRLYQKAVEAGEPQAMINLYLMIEKGLIKPTNKTNKQAMEKLLSQALHKNNSNAYLMAGLKKMNYKLDEIKERELNSKIRKSLQMHNPHTIDLIQKMRKPKFINKQVQISHNQLQIKSRKLIRQGMSPDQTIHYNYIKKVKSSDHLKTARV